MRKILCLASSHRGQLRVINTAVSPDHHDRDADTGWTIAVDDKREERRYYTDSV